MSKRTGLRLSNREIDQIVRILDKNKDGKVDFREFAAVIGDYLKPPSKPTGFSLNFGENDYQHCRHKGKKMLSINNQTKDAEDETGKPLIQVCASLCEVDLVPWNYRSLLLHVMIADYC